MNEITLTVTVSLETAHEILDLIQIEAMAQAKAERQDQKDGIESELMTNNEYGIEGDEEGEGDEPNAKRYQEAREIIDGLNAQIEEDTKAEGEPVEFAPRAHVCWMARGENALKERRAELRKVLVTEALHSKSPRVWRSMCTASLLNANCSDVVLPSLCQDRAGSTATSARMPYR